MVTMSALKKPYWFYLWCLFALIPLSWVPLFDVDEGAFSEATREMLVSGNYLTTYLYGMPRFDKPIAIYWLQALSATVFGINTWAMRLPSVCAATIWLLSIYNFVKRYYTKDIAWTAMLFFIGSLQINIIAKSAIADALLNMSICVSMLCLWQFIQHRQQQDLLLAYAMFGLGILAKGPIALIIPIITLLTYSFCTSDRSWFYPVVVAPKAWLCMLLLCLPWYLLELYDQGWHFIEGFFWQHNLNRALSVMETHSGGWWYYLLVIVLGLMPFSGCLLSFLTSWRQIIANDRERYLLCWALSVIAFFTIISTKLPHYVVYAYTPIIILMAVYAQQMLQQSRFILLPLLFLVLLLSAIPWVLDIIDTWSSSPLLSYYLPALRQVFSWAFLYYLWGSFLLLVLMWYLPFMRIWRQLLVVLWSLSMLHMLLMPRIAMVLQVPVYEAAQLAKQNAWPVTMYRAHLPSFAFYTASIPKRTAPQPGDVVLTKSWLQSDFSKYRVLFEKNGVILLRIESDD